MAVLGDSAGGRVTGVDGAVARAVREGLTVRPKRLPPWLFYDEAGSLLFERITELPEYTLTRRERGLLAEFAGEMVQLAADGKRLRVVELGAGSAEKTRLLLAAAVAMQGGVVYEPVDVSETALEAACARLKAEVPGVETRPVVADYTAGWQPEESEERSLLAWIGSSIGNFEPGEATAMLKRMGAGMKVGDGLLLGVDLRPVEDPRDGGKSVEMLVAAYDDAAGVTAEFNQNVLRRVNRELGGDFDAEAFRHVALWNAEERRMEMHLESVGAQRVRVAGLGLEVEFEAGERLHTENSYKYTVEQAERLMAEAGFPSVGRWVDGDGWFGLVLGRRVS